MKHLAPVLSVCLAAANTASAQLIVDGTADAYFYGAAMSIQNTDTGFGNSTDPDPRTSAGGSELDQVFGTVDGGFLYLTFAGNLEGDFHTLDIFIDSQTLVGMNTLDGANLPAAVDASCCGGLGTTDGALQRMSGLTFDVGFEADYYVTVSNGTQSTGGASGPSGWIASAHFAELNSGAGGANVRVGGVLDPFGDELDASGVSRGLIPGTVIDQNNSLFAAPPPDDIPLHEFFEPWDAVADPANTLNHRDMDNTIGMLLAVNQSNTVGVNGSAGPDFSTLGDPANVTTGIELAIPLSAIGAPPPGAPIKITAFINSAGHDFASNQFAGIGILQGNPGSPASLDLSTIDGDQFVTISQCGTTVLEGDLNCDRWVGLADLNMVLSHWNQSVTPGDFTMGDPSGDGFVGILDLNVVLGDWNSGTPPLAVAPEPAMLALLGIGGIAVLRRW